MKKKISIFNFPRISFIVIFSFLFFSYFLNAQKEKPKKNPVEANSVCLDCHSDPDISMDKKGATVSLSVKNFTLARSIHSKLKCKECHVGFDEGSIPHKEKIETVNCSSCHKDAASKHLFHPQMKNVSGSVNPLITNCKGCHGTHEVTSSKNPSSNTNFINSTNHCGKCHKVEKDKHLKSDHYIELNKQNPNAPTCIYCHRLPITKGSTNDDLKLKVNREKLCESCHLNNPSSTSKYAKTLVNYERSVHGMAIKKGNKNAAVCIDCHGTHDLQKASSPTSSINRYRIPDVCGKCHIAISQEYLSSIHGSMMKKGNMDTPGCTYCHGEHDIAPMKDVTQRVISEHKMNLKTIVSNKMIYCVGCHTNKKLMDKYNISTIEKAHDWLPNIDKHWETVRCVDCHSSYDPPNLSHNLLPPEQTIKKCEICHSKNSILMTKLYKHEKERSREKLGFINGTILSDAYVIGTTRNVYLDFLSLSVFGLVIFGISLHAFIRWYFRKGIVLDKDFDKSSDDMN